MNEEQKYIDYESYERVAEPHKREKVSAWRTAIGLQDVDGLRVHEYLKKQLKKTEKHVHMSQLVIESSDIQSVTIATYSQKHVATCRSHVTRIFGIN